MASSRKITALLGAAALATALAACGTDEPATGPRPTGPSSRLRVANVTPDPTLGGAENVAIGDQVFAAGLAYGAATSYQRVYTGQRDLHVRRTSDTTIKVTDLVFNIAADFDFTTFIMGKTVANGGTGVSGVMVPDDNTPPPAGNVKLRFVNASPTAGSVDIYITAPNVSLTTLTPDVAALNYGSVSAYVTKPAGTYQVRVTTAGTKTVLVTIPQPTPIPTPAPSPAVSAFPALVAGQIRTIVVLDRTGGGTPITAAVYQDRNP